ncbi:MAG: DUF1587 domain-containing protein, partial [Gammaproteobacteria bacterium]
MKTRTTTRVLITLLGVAFGTCCVSAVAEDSEPAQAVVGSPQKSEAEAAKTKTAPEAPPTSAPAAGAPADTKPAADASSKKEAGSKDAGSKEASSNEAGSKEAGSKEASSKEASSKEASSKEANSKEADAVHGNPTEWQFFDHYCSKCHNSTDWAGGVAFDTMTPEGISDDAQVWEEAVRKMRGRLMPPPDKPQPDQQAIDSQVAWLETKLDGVAKENPNPGSVVMHRLNRTEYAREVENLLGLKIDAAALLPKDTKADGFDNVANVLKVSPSFLDQYIVAAHDVSVQALGNASPAPSSVIYRAPEFARQDVHLEGMPLGTRGGMLVEHLFPADGEYTVNLNQSGGGGGGYVAGLDSRHTLILTLDGVKV